MRREGTVARLTVEDRDRGTWVVYSDEEPWGTGSAGAAAAVGSAGGAAVGSPGAGAAGSTEGAPSVGPRVVVVAGGAAPPEERLRAEAGRAHVLVCADGGLKAAWSAGLAPDLVAGDLDSLPSWARELLPAGVIHGDPKADDNDLEKAVREIFRRWGAAAELSILGGGEGGGRTDHALANLGVLLAEPHRRIQWVDAAGRMIALRGGRITADDLVGATLSVLPWSLHGAVVSEVGVHYPLDEERLYLGGRGVSNEVGDETAAVEVHEGVALVWVGI